MKDHAPAPKDTMILDVVVVLGAVLVLYVSAHITPITLDTVLSGEAPSILLSYIFGNINVAAIQNFVLPFQNFLGVLGIVFLGGIFWLTIKINELHHSEHVKYEPIPLEEVVAKGMATQWKVVLEHITSENPAEWKLAILEADNMLDEILEDQGYTGDTLADKLKAISPTKMTSYNEVWEAHKLRNQIAHGGAIDMDLTKKMARDAVANFGNAFKELGYL